MKFVPSLSLVREAGILSIYWLKASPVRFMREGDREGGEESKREAGNRREKRSRSFACETSGDRYLRSGF